MELSWRKAVLISIAGILMNAIWPQDWAKEGDFQSFYTGFALSGTDARYDTAANLAFHRSLGLEERPDLVSPRMPWYDFAFRWMTVIPLPVAKWVWRGMNLAALLVFAWVLPIGSRTGRFLALAVFNPVYHLLTMAQDVGFVLGLFAVSLSLWKKGRPTAAGLVLGLCGIKWHLFLLVAGVLLAHRQWAYFRGLAGMATVLTIVSTFVQGPKWFWGYSQLRKPDSVWHADLMITLKGVWGGDHPMRFLLGALLLVALWVIVRRAPFAIGVVFALMVNVLLSPHAYLSDACLFLPALLAIAPEWPRVAWAQMSPWPLPVTFLTTLYSVMLFPEWGPPPAAAGFRIDVVVTVTSAVLTVLWMGYAGRWEAAERRFA